MEKSINTTSIGNLTYETVASLSLNTGGSIDKKEVLALLDSFSFVGRRVEHVEILDISYNVITQPNKLVISFIIKTKCTASYKFVQPDVNYNVLRKIETSLEVLER